MTGKKRIFAGMGILLGGLVGVQGTAAYQSAYDKAVNIVTPENISSEMIDELNLKIHSYKENKENASATIKNYIFKSRLWHANEIKLKSLYSNI